MVQVSLLRGWRDVFACGVRAGQVWSGLGSAARLVRRACDDRKGWASRTAIV